MNYPDAGVIVAPTVAADVDLAGDPLPGVPTETPAGGRLQQASSAEVLQGRDTTTTDALLFLPPDAPIAADCQWRDGSGRGTFDVVGDPNRLDDLAGRPHHLEVRLRKVADV